MGSRVWSEVRLPKGELWRVQSREAFLFSAEGGAHLSGSATVCALFERQEIKEIDYICVGPIHLSKLGHFFICFTGDCIIMMKIQRDCVRRGWKVQHITICFFKFCFTLRVLADWMIRGSQMQSGALIESESRSPSFFIWSHVKAGRLKLSCISLFVLSAE